MKRMRKLILLFILNSLSISLFTQVSFKNQIIGQINFSPSQFYLADMNNDEKIDILVRGDDNINIYENQGENQYKRYIIFKKYSGEISIGDIDKDGDLDIFVAHSETSILLNQGNMKFEAIPIELEPDFYIAESAIKDIDQDGQVDIFCSRSWRKGLFWWKNMGDLKFEKQMVDSFYNGVESVAIVDFDQDQDLDMITSEHHDDRFMSWENKGDGQFEGKVIHREFYETPFIVKDLNKDDRPDLLWKNMRLYLHKDSFNFEKILVEEDTRYKPIYDAADLDNDGDLDIVGEYNDGNDNLTLAWWENDGAFKFKRHDIKKFEGFVIGYAALGDMDNDGDIDIITTSFVTDKVELWENQLK